MALKAKKAENKQLLELLKDLDADGSLKQKAFKYLRCNLAALTRADDFTQAASNLAALSTVLSEFGSQYKDYIKMQFDMLREIRHLVELKEANRMLSQPEKAERIMKLLRPFLPKDFWLQIEDLLNTFMGECEEE